MTLVLPAEQTQNRAITAANGRFSVCSRQVAFGALLAATAVLYLWNLSASGWANAFYSAAVQAGAQNWTAMLFGSSDPANAITVDKTPAALWVMDLSVRLFGLNSWSILVPQALMGVAAVAVLYAAVRRVSGPGAALLAGAVLAATPVAALMFRFNNPDALLVLLLVVAGYCVTRACERDAGRWWLMAAGVAVGFGFLAKMLQALLVLPGFAVAYLVAGGRPVGRRLLALVGAAAAMVVAGGWYLLLAEVWPPGDRPYIGGSQRDSIVELALGYNGFGRLTGNETGGLGNLNHDVGAGRLFGFGMGLDIAWLLPAALICLGAGLVLTRRAPRTDVTRAALLNWGGWLVVTAVVFSFANGIVHSYYTVALAPAIAAVIGIGAHLLWRNRFHPWCAVALAGAVLVTTVLAAVLLSRHVEWMPWLRAAVAVGGVGVAVLLLVVRRLPDGVARTVAAVAVIVSLASPAAYSVVTAANPHTGAIPSVGPAGGFSGGPPGLLNSPEPDAELTATLARDAHDYRWAAAVVGSNNAAGYQLASGAAVLALGGFNGTDPSPTLEQFQRYVADGDVHYFIGGRSALGFGDRAAQSGSRAAADIADWVQEHFESRLVGGVAVYDLTHGAAS
ncbi:glycosyltransferase family 39 protein [Mycolicibacterium litorale]|uniref:Glycosyl transferase n=1 Tax=Mycolicibacterium litorale TaxID=758802 RepID=A0AAD1IJG7_9MYCO|nr:glycosyltransferase family 39 protein [Mycolicibacterium litorale]MCV7414635.1 glycosyltransferase family 39 protein [Mycolicibacterium litorale]TDY00870.1 4-amino-4-deoxy-L-arabinose transferase-like glycosyltransferase [Mycolicibacterium litorale]BBY14767.1 glycosyl transferase [Mycolicibacterium litorale]